MKRLLSFRGNLTAIADNARSLDNEIFTYQSSDLTRAWKVKSFYLWPATVRAETGTGDGQFMLNVSLATDEVRIHILSEQTNLYA